MTARTISVTPRRIIAALAPVIVVALAGMAVRTPLAAAYPVAALLLFLWIVSDTSMLALMARSSGRPAWHAVVGVLASASMIVWLAAPPPLRAVVTSSPPIAGGMAVVVLAHVAWVTVRARCVLRRPGMATTDRRIAVAAEFLPPALVRLAAAELSLIHMALFRWGGPADVPAHSRAFAYHNHLTPMCATLLILSTIELAVYHLLLGHSSRTAAIVMFVVSDLGFVYLVGLIKSFRFRPVLQTPDGVTVRAGFLIDEAIPLDSIIGVETGFGGDRVRDRATLNAALLAWPNIMLQLDRPLHRRSILKKNRSYSAVAFRLDDPEPFVRLLRWRLGQRPG